MPYPLYHWSVQRADFKFIIFYLILIWIPKQVNIELINVEGDSVF